MSSSLCDNLLVGVSGGIQCVNLHNYLFHFRTVLARQVKVIMTPSAAKMVSPAVLELYLDDRVFVDFWDRSTEVKTPHIQLTRWADLFVVVRASGKQAWRHQHRKRSCGT
ncbi:flavoprotein [Calidithermus chliarophilus]|uniref:flavoprotein n=1 Tax=Calidithermus chliarophilus TaxID=52023 RepID=UPI0006867A58|nr:flavoprotein [Calidithermus chliarophilus]